MALPRAFSSPGDQHVVEDGLFVDVEAGGDGPQPVGPERVLGVDEDDLAAAVAGRSVRHLRRHAERVRELRLPRAELAERLGDGHGLDAAAEDRVELGASRRQAEHGLSIYARLESGDEVSATRSESFPFLLELLCHMPNSYPPDPSLRTASLILSTLASLRPLMAQSFFLVII